MINFVNELNMSISPVQKKVEEKRKEQAALQGKAKELTHQIKVLQTEYVETLDEKVLDKVNKISEEIRSINTQIVQLEEIIKVLVPGKVHIPKGVITKELKEAFDKKRLEQQLEKIKEAKQRYLLEIQILGDMAVTLEDNLRDVGSVKHILDEDGNQEIKNFVESSRSTITPNKIYCDDYSISGDEVTRIFGRVLRHYSDGFRRLK